MRSLLVTITTTPERIDAALAVRDQLARFNLTPTINLSTPTQANADLLPTIQQRLSDQQLEVMVTGNPAKGYGGRNNARAFQQAFTTARARGMDLLYCEDDITFASDFALFFNEARTIPDAVVWFYTHDYRAEVDQARRYGRETWQRLKDAARYRQPFTPKGLYRMVDASKANSGQCFHVPWGVLDALPLHELDTQSSPVDRWTQDRVPRSGFATLVALPHPVQHLVNRTGREAPRDEAGRRKKTSMSFDLR